LSHLPILLPGFEIEEVSCGKNEITITARATSPTASCPFCDQRATRVHNYYLRSPHDLPSSGLSVHLQLRVRLFRCQNEDCPRQTFVERLPELVAVSAQRTVRLTRLLQAFSIALPRRNRGSSVGRCWSVNQCRYAVAAGQAQPVTRRGDAPSAIGVGDFSLRREQTYGTIVIDQSTHRPINLPTERTAETLSRWLEDCLTSISSGGITPSGDSTRTII
jgi:transposase